MILNKEIAESLVNKGKLIKDRIKQSYNICIYKQFCSQQIFKILLNRL